MQRFEIPLQILRAKEEEEEVKDTRGLCQCVLKSNYELEDLILEAGGEKRYRTILNTLYLQFQ